MLVPSARELIFTPFNSGILRASNDLKNLDSVNVVSEPRSLREQAAWMLAAAQKSEAQVPLRADELKSLQSIVSRATSLQTHNAFWTQSRALLAYWNGNDREAQILWQQSAQSPDWIDYETQDSNEWKSGLAVEPALSMIRIRNDYVASLISMVRHLVREPHNSLSDLQLRYATLLNGDLIRKHARTVETALDAIRLEDASVQPKDVLMPLEHRDLLISRIELSQQLQKEPGIGLAQPIENLYKESDAEFALLSQYDWKDDITTLQMDAAVTDLLPGLALLGTAIAFFGYFAMLLFAQLSRGTRFRTVIIPAVAVVTMIASSFLMPAAVVLTLGLAIGFTVLDRPGAGTTKRKFPTFTVACFEYLGAVWGICLTLFVFLLHPVVQSLFSRGPLKSFNLVITGFGVIGLLTASTLLSVSLTGFIHRCRFSESALKVNRSMWTGAAVTSLFIFVVSTGVALRQNPKLFLTLSHMAENQPVFYLNR